MLNEYKNNQNVEIKPACTGMLQKSHPKSYFKWCHVNSNFRQNVVDGNPRVLQVMVFGDNNGGNTGGGSQDTGGELEP